MFLRFSIARILVVLSFLPAVLNAQTQASPALAAQASAASSPLGAVVPGRFIVTYRNGAVPANAGTRIQMGGARLVQRNERLGIGVVQSSAIDSEATRARLALDPAVELVVQDRIVSAHALKVRAAAPATAGPDSLYYSAQGWAVRQAGGFGTPVGLGNVAHPNAAIAPAVAGPWNITIGAGIRIAILDSGVDAAHPDIAPNLSINLSEIDQSATSGLPSPCDDGTPQDQQGHGTWTASLAAGSLGAATGLVAGVAPGANLINIKVLERLPSTVTSASDPSGCAAGEAGGLLSWVIQGIEDAVAQRADVISMSLGTLVDITTGDGAGLKATFDHVTHAASEAGVVLIAAAGNDGFNLDNQRFLELPAQARDVLAIVASTNPDCAENLSPGAVCTAGPITMPYYSNFGTPMNALAAPGGSYPSGSAADSGAASGWIQGACSMGKPSTLSGVPSDAAHSLGCFGLGHTPYVQAMGTSASAALAAGAAALLRAANPTWSAAAVVAALRSSAVSTPGLPVPQINIAGLMAGSSAGRSHHILNQNQQ